jgi:hypothetical protein
MSQQYHEDALAQIAHIDFLLDELARAVERGEVPRASYELMAPRYLNRRSELVALITGVPRESARPAVSPQVPPVTAAGSQAFDEYFAPASGHVRSAPRPRKPVDWTTILLFLGAFLVVVASAIFSVVVWEELGTAAKIAFLGALTVGFYAVAWWANARLRLTVGSVALASVGSAMLLFDGWILIDGYGLTGPMPWAALLLVCSAVYWYTEVLLAARFFGVVGAAAQVAWWWLLGEGLGLPMVTRVAGIAAVALVWQVAAERGRGRPGVGGLASVLEWAAPIVAAGASFTILVDLVFVGASDVKAVVAAGLTAIAAGQTMWRSGLLPKLWNGPLAAGVQIPLLVSAWVATADAGGSWWVFGVFLVVALVYDVIALGSGGVAFLVVGLFAEASAVIELCRLLDLDPTWTLVALGGLAAVWALTSRLAGRLSAGGVLAGSRVRELARVTEAAAWGMLAATSLGLQAARMADSTLPIPGFDLGRSDAMAYLGLLLAWWAAVVARPRGAAAFVGSLWAFVTLSAIFTWRLPDGTLPLWAAALVVLCGVWLASAGAQRRVYGELWGAVTRWCARGLTYALFVVGTLGVLSFGGSGGAAVLGVGPQWHPAVLAVVTGLFCLIDAATARCRSSAAFAGVALTISVYLAVDAWPHAAGRDIRLMAVAFAGLAISLAAMWLSRHPRFGKLAGFLAAPAMVVASLLAAYLNGHDTWMSVPWNTLGWITIAAGWAAVSVVTVQSVSFVAGLVLIPAAWSALGVAPGSFAVLAVFGAAGLLLGVSSLFPLFRPGARLAETGSVLGAAGAIVILAPVIDGALSGHLLSVAYLLLAAYTAALAGLRDVEYTYYLAGFPLVLAVWTETGALSQPSPALFSTPLALYLVAVGHLYLWQGRRRGLTRTYPVAIDVFAVLVGLGYPLLAALQALPQREFVESLAVLALSLVAIAVGVGLKVRWYFFGGVVSLAAVAFYRSFSAIAEYWWLVLGIVGVAMLAIALTWERQRMVVSDTRDKLRRSFEGWR